MRVFVVTINYAPEPSGFAPHAAQLAGYLARRGHQVDVFTGFPFAPAWRRRPEDRGRLYATERAGGVTVHRVTHYIPRRPSSVGQRVLMEGSFAASVLAAMAAVMLGSRRRPDAMLYIGAQPAAAMATRIAAAAVRRPYFVRITDLAADAAQDVGMVGRRLGRVLAAFEFAAYRRAAGASVLCPSFSDVLAGHGYPADRIRVLHNPIDTDLIRPLVPAGEFRARYDIPRDAFVLMHAGSMGRKQALVNVVAAAALTRDAGLHWVFVGGGEGEAELAAAVRARGANAVVHLVPFQPEPEMAAMFADADVLVVSQLGSVTNTLIPGKLLTYMAAGRPVLAAVHAASQAAALLRDADGGLLVAPEDPEALGAAARALAAADRRTLAALGARNRAYAEQHFDERKILAAHEAFFLETLGLPAPAP
ncbi:MAG: glycosyltransferase [Acidobacteria bacterium]|nr:glycosyltransferase [Acidobacteriota bacterium]